MSEVPLQECTPAWLKGGTLSEQSRRKGLVLGPEEGVFQGLWRSRPAGCEVWFWFKVWGLWFMVYGLWFMVYGFGFRVSGFGFRV